MPGICVVEGAVEEAGLWNRSTSQRDDFVAQSSYLHETFDVRASWSCHVGIPHIVEVLGALRVLKIV